MTGATAIPRHGPIEAARKLVRTMPGPKARTAWAEIRPGLMALELQLRRQLQENPTDGATAELLAEVRRYLGKHG